MKRRNLWSNLARILLSVITLVILLREVGGGKVLAVLRGADWGLLVVAVALFLAGIVVRTFRWRALLQGLGVRPPFWRLLKLYLVGGFFNAFLPSGFGGDVVRVVELAQGEQRSAALGTVLVDRMTGILSQMAMGLLVLPFAAALEPWLVWTFVVVAVGGLFGGFLVLEGRLLRRFTERLPGPLSLAGQGKLAQVYAAISGCGPRAVWVALGLSTLFNLINIVIYWFCARAVGITVGIDFYFIAVPLLSLTLLVPISVGGLGARDWVGQPLFNSVGVLSAQAAGMTLSVYAVTAAAGLVGGLIYLWQGFSGLVRPRPGGEEVDA